jgi:hypothetical protein
MDQGAQRRENFRIAYPAAESPWAILFGEKFRIVDLSAAGLRIHVGDTKPQFIGMIQDIDVGLELACGKTVKVVARFLREVGADVVFNLTLNVPANLINEEQIYLRKKYPAH